jgi:hypothetical protein
MPAAVVVEVPGGGAPRQFSIFIATFPSCSIRSLEKKLSSWIAMLLRVYADVQAFSFTYHVCTYVIAKYVGMIYCALACHSRRAERVILRKTDLKVKRM